MPERRRRDDVPDGRQTLPDALRELRLAAEEHRLLAAHDVEFILPETASASVRHALAAACHEGWALGLDAAIATLRANMSTSAMPSE